MFNNFQCPQNIDPLLFSQLYIYYYKDIRPAVINEIQKGDYIYTKSIITNGNIKVVYKKGQKFSDLQEGPVGTVQIGIDRELICVPGNATLIVPWKTSKRNSGWSYIVQQAAHHNLPSGLVVNSCCITPNPRRVPVILISITDQNTWVKTTLAGHRAIWSRSTPPAVPCRNGQRRWNNLIPASAST